MRNNRYLWAFFTLLLAVVPVVATAAEPAADILPFKATTRTLPNGLVVMVVPTGFPNIVSLTIGPRVAINIARIGMMKADFVEGAMYAYCNRLPEAEKEAALSLAKRVLA